jgi:hypothetical protein
MSSHSPARALCETRYRGGRRGPPDNELRFQAIRPSAGPAYFARQVKSGLPPPKVVPEV